MARMAEEAGSRIFMSESISSRQILVTEAVKEGSIKRFLLALGTGKCLQNNHG